MTESKPDCLDFIVAAIRALRVNPANLKEGTSAGVRLERVWSVASEVYSETEFRVALNGLLETKAVVMVWKIWEDVTPSSNLGPLRTRFVSVIPDKMPLSATGRHYRDVNGNFMGYGEEERLDKYDQLSKIMLYVSADGLPKMVVGSKRNPSRKTASDIIASMRKGDRR